MTRRRAAVALAALLALAGCSGFGAGGPASPTLSPVPVDEPDGPLPGLDEPGDGVDPRALARAHRRAAMEVNYTVRISERISTPDGDLLRERLVSRAVARGGDRYRGTVRSNATARPLMEFGTTDYWSNGTHVATRFTSPLRPAQTRLWRTDSGGPVGSPSNSRRLAELVRVSEPRVVARPDDGTVVLAATRPLPRGTVDVPAELTAPRNISTRFVVREDGLVTRWSVAYTATFRSDPVRVLERGRLSGVGSTAVTQPAWARNATVIRSE